MKKGLTWQKQSTKEMHLSKTCNIKQKGSAHEREEFAGHSSKSLNCYSYINTKKHFQKTVSSARI